jgi:hypothetical protein
VPKRLRNENGTQLPNGKIPMQKHFLHLSWGSDLVLSSKLSTTEGKKNKIQKRLVHMRKKNSKESQHESVIIQALKHASGSRMARSDQNLVCSQFPRHAKEDHIAKV